MLMGVFVMTPRLDAQTPAVEATLEQLTLADKAAQLIMLWVDGSPPTPENGAYHQLVGLIESQHIGGLVMSTGTPTSAAGKLSLLQDRSRIPLLVAADFEAGTGFRLRGGSTFPTNMGVGASGSEAAAYTMGQIIAEEARALGVHITFSPVVDVNNNPENPIINTRSFGSDPDLVARMGAAQIRGSQEHGVFATAKHFPGHGNTSTDSHLALPVIDKSWAELSSLELRPFRSAIEAGVEIVMSAHIALPNLHPKRDAERRPATMLPEVLTGILRDSLGFQGLVVTDALDMGGVVRGYGPGEAAVQAFLAGSDILLMPTDPIQAIEAIVQAVEAGRISSSRLDRSVRRILVLKERMGLFTTRQVRLDAVDSVFDRASSKQATARASAEALVLVKDSDAVIDSIQVRKRSLTVVTYGEANAGSVGRTLTAELERRGYATRRFALSPASLPASYDSAQRLLDSARIRLVVVSIRALESKGALGTPEPLVSLLTRRSAGGQTLLISLGSPYLLSHVPNVPGYIVGWESNPIVERALAAALMGDPITGRLPVEIPPSWPVGWGIQRGTQP